MPSQSFVRTEPHTRYAGGPIVLGPAFPLEDRGEGTAPRVTERASASKLSERSSNGCRIRLGSPAEARTESRTPFPIGPSSLSNAKRSSTSSRPRTKARGHPSFSKSCSTARSSRSNEATYGIRGQTTSSPSIRQAWMKRKTAHPGKATRTRPLGSVPSDPHRSSSASGCIDSRTPRCRPRGTSIGCACSIVGSPRRKRIPQSRRP